MSDQPPPVPGRDELPRPNGAYFRRRRQLRIVAASIVVACGVSGWCVGHLTGPALGRWEISRIDQHMIRPERPALPPDPFPTST